MDIMAEEGEQQTVISKAESSRQMVSEWLEKGFDKNAIAGYGTSVENLKKILSNENIPSFDPGSHPHFLQEEFKAGKYIYYFFPILATLRRENPQLTNEIIDRFNEQDAEVVSEEVELGLEHYRKRNAFDDYMIKTGNVSSSETIAPDIIEDALEELDGQPRFQYQVGDMVGHSGKVDWLKEKLQDPQFKAQFEKARARGGVVIYFNKKIFSDSALSEKVEDDGEVILIRDIPLAKDSISGIEVFTDEEREEVLKIA
jgi:hypothetical protein